jgi:hypothetical protein
VELNGRSGPKRVDTLGGPLKSSGHSLDVHAQQYGLHLHEVEGFEIIFLLIGRQWAVFVGQIATA